MGDFLLKETTLDSIAATIRVARRIPLEPLPEQGAALFLFV